MSGSLFKRLRAFFSSPVARESESASLASSPPTPPRRPLVETAAELAAAVDGIDWSAAAVQAAWRQLDREGKTANEEERAAALDVLLDRLRRSHVDHADGVAHLALSAGAIVESGVGPYPLGDLLLEKMPAVLVAARRFADTCFATMGERSDAEDDLPAEEVATFVDDRPLPWATFRRHLAADRPGAAALAYLREWTLPTVAALTRDRRLLERATQDDAFGRACAPLARSDAGWLHTLTGVQLEAPWLALFPLLQRGFLVTVDGVANNFDLHALLADSLIAAGIEGARNPGEVIAVLRGDALASSVDGVVGSWNLYTHGAAGFDLSQPSTVPDQHWVWGEGQPRDVPRFEGVRTLLIGPPAYRRSWGLGRTFAALRPRVDLVEELPRELVRERLAHMGRHRP